MLGGREDILRSRFTRSRVHGTRLRCRYFRKRYHIAGGIAPRIISLVQRKIHQVASQREAMSIPGKGCAVW